MNITKKVEGSTLKRLSSEYPKMGQKILLYEALEYDPTTVVRIECNHIYPVGPYTKSSEKPRSSAPQTEKFILLSNDSYTSFKCISCNLTFDILPQLRPNYYWEPAEESK